MDKMTKKIGIVFVVLVAAAILVYAGVRVYQQNEAQGDAETLPKTEVGKLKAKDLELEYPGTPTEVVKLYWRLNKCLYNTNMKEKDFEALYQQLRLLYDDEFLAQDGNSYDDMLAALKEDIESFDEDKRFISSYTVQDDEDVTYAKMKGKECATLTVSVLETSKKTKSAQMTAEFIYREDSQEHWKILGWKQTTESNE